MKLVWARVGLIICGILWIRMIIYLFSWDVTDAGVNTESYYHHRNAAAIHSADTFIETNKRIQKDRFERIQLMCRMSIMTQSEYSGIHEPTYFYSPTYNFTFCKVLKSGSTFVGKTFELLNTGTSNTDELFTRKRTLIHENDYRFQINFNSSIRQRAPAVLVSRDPYSRLYSAYIDKFYVPERFEDFYEVIQDKNTTIRSECPRDVSFQEFLDYVVREALAGKTINNHWAPIVSICRPCDGNTVLLVKQETFSTDIEYILNVFHVAREKAAILLNKLNNQRTESTIPGIVKTVFHNVKRNNALNCLGYREIATRLWNFFQITGFLNNTLHFPIDISESGLRNVTFLSDTILKVIALHPLSDEQQLQQRRAALVGAYRKVNKKTIEQLKQVYKNDFDTFAYSEEPPLF